MDKWERNGGWVNKSVQGTRLIGRAREAHGWVRKAKERKDQE